MKNILHLIASPRGNESFSIKLGQAIIARFLDKYPESKVEEVDLLGTNVSHLHTGQPAVFFHPGRATYAGRPERNTIF